MALLDVILKIIGNKFFILLIGIGMCFALPTLWYNITVVSNWQTVGTFAICLISIFLCCYKFVSMTFGGKKQATPQQGTW